MSLHPVDLAQAQRIHNRAPNRDDAWADGYPFDGDLAAIGGFLRASEQHGEQRPFGYYQIVRSSDGQAIGGIGFRGPPEDGTVEIGYGLIADARGHGYANEALAALLAVATQLGVVTIVASTSPDNIASQRTLERGGFHQVEADRSNQVETDEELLHYEIRLPAGGVDFSN